MPDRKRIEWLVVTPTGLRVYASKKAALKDYDADDQAVRVIRGVSRFTGGWWTNHGLENTVVVERHPIADVAETQARRLGHSMDTPSALIDRHKRPRRA